MSMRGLLHLGGCVASVMVMLHAGMAVAAEPDLDTLRSRASGGVVHYPGDAESLQAAVDQAEAGGLVLIAPGEYRESVVLGSKAVTIASMYFTTGETKYIAATVLDGKDPKGEDGRSEQVILVEADAPETTQIVGLTIQKGDDGISCEADVHIVMNRFLGNVDAIDYEGGGGVCAYNVFEANEDDAIDLDGPCQGYFEHNIIRGNKDDGIEIRLHPYDGPLRTAVIRHNWIEGSGEDGIQFIDYFDSSNRAFRIERNYIVDSAMAGIGFMSGTNTRENYEAADVDESVLVLNNTFLRNTYGITGGNNVVALNNIIAGCKETALKGVDYNSVVSHVLLWENGKNIEDSNVFPDTVVEADPGLDANHAISSDSPAAGAGILKLELEDRAAVSVDTGSFHGKAPELGAFELE